MCDCIWLSCWCEEQKISKLAYEVRNLVRDMLYQCTDSNSPEQQESNLLKVLQALWKYKDLKTLALKLLDIKKAMKIKEIDESIQEDKQEKAEDVAEEKWIMWMVEQL